MRRGGASGQGFQQQHGAEIVGYIDSTAFRTAMVAAMAAAIDNAAEVSIVIGTETSLMPSDDELSAPAAVLRDTIERSRSLATRARKLAVAAESDDAMGDFLDEARKHDQKACDAAERLKLLTTHVPAASPDSFTTDGDRVLNTLKHLAGPNDMVTREELAAFQMVMPSLRLIPPTAAQGWTAEAFLRLPIEGGVAEIGPITWEVEGMGAKSAASIRSRLPLRNQEAATAIQLRERLREIPGMTKAAIGVAVNCPLVEVPNLLLHAGLEEPLPAWVSDEWREPSLIKAIAAAYINADFQGSVKAHWAQMSHWRQAQLNLAIKSDGITFDDALAVIPVFRPNHWNTDHFLKKGRVPWPLAVEIIDGPTGAKIARPYQCWCGEMVTTIARVPEVEGSALCAARHQSLASTKEARRVKFPAVYELLRLSWEECVAYLTREKPAQTETKDAVEAALSNKVRQAVVRQLHSLDPDVTQTCDEIAEAIGEPYFKVQRALTYLHQPGYLTREGGRPIQWALTEPGRGLAASAQLPTD